MKKKMKKKKEEEEEEEDEEEEEEEREGAGETRCAARKAARPGVVLVEVGMWGARRTQRRRNGLGVESARAHTVVRHGHFRADEEDFPVEAENAAVVAHAAVEQGHAHVAEDPVCEIRAEEVCQ